MSASVLEQETLVTLETIREAHQARPFHAFTLQLADGRSVEVTHPENLLLPPGEKGRTIVIWDRHAQLRLIDLLLVVELTFASNRGRKRSA